MVYYKTMDATKLAEQILDEARAIMEEYEEEPVVGGPVEIKINSNWTATTPDIFRSWTGQRRIWGVEYHGPVYVLGAKEETLYKGKRICGCSDCQANVSPEFKYN